MIIHSDVAEKFLDGTCGVRCVCVAVLWAFTSSTCTELKIPVPPRARCAWLSKTSRTPEAEPTFRWIDSNEVQIQLILELLRDIII